MKKIFLTLIVLFSLSLFFAPAHPAQAFMSLTDNIDACLASGDCTICDVLTVLFNFAKFIYITMAGLVLLFILWQSILIIMNFGNSENIKTATDKIKSTLLAALIILASYTLVGALITVYSGGTFKTFIKGQISTDWTVGPICERGTRPENQVVNNGDNQSLVSDGGCGADVNKDCTCIQDGSNGSAGCNCGNINTAFSANQCNDASIQLESALECVKRKNSGYNLVITSISDDAGLSRCRSNYSKPPCAHTVDSCHYGGSGADNKNGSYAVDFRTRDFNENALDWLRSAVDDCFGKGRYIDHSKESNPHLHASVSACSGE